MSAVDMLGNDVISLLRRAPPFQLEVTSSNEEIGDVEAPALAPHAGSISAVPVYEAEARAEVPVEVCAHGAHGEDDLIPPGQPEPMEAALIPEKMNKEKEMELEVATASTSPGPSTTTPGSVGTTTPLRFEDFDGGDPNDLDTNLDMQDPAKPEDYLNELIASAGIGPAKNQEEEEEAESTDSPPAGSREQKFKEAHNDVWKTRLVIFQG